MAKEKAKGGSIHINYHLKREVGTPSDKFIVSMNRSDKGIHFVFNGGIESLEEMDMDTVEGLLKGLTDFDGEMCTDEKHVMTCREAAKALNTLADFLEK